MTAAPVIPNLWPEDIQVSALPPVVVLRMQAEGLRERTKGALEAEVTTTKGAEDFEIHRLQVVARQLGGSRYGIVSVTHRTELYPAVVEAKMFEPSATPKSAADLMAAASLGHAALIRAALVQGPRPWPDPEDWRPIAASQEQLLELLGRVLRSMPVRSLVESLLARVYEKQQAQEPAGQSAD